MDHSGVVGPDELASFTWERCPDRDGRPVLRLSKGLARWILWQGSVDFSIYSSSLPRERGWRRLVFADATDSLSEVNVAYLTSFLEKNQTVWLAVELGSMQSVDVLFDRFGLPPHEVLSDWREQSASPLAAHRLSHLLVSPDGRLFSLSSMEALVGRTIQAPSHSCALNGSLPIPEGDFLRDIPNAGPTAGRLIDELLHSTRTPADKKLENIFSVNPALSKSTLRKPSASERSPKNRWSKRMLWISLATTGLVLVGGLAVLMNSPSKQLAQREIRTPVVSASAKKEVLPASELPLGEIDSTMPLELARDEQTLPDNDLNDQASSSLQKLFGGIGGGKLSESIDSISFESVEGILKETSDDAIVQQSLAESGSDMPGAMSESTAPFSESLDAVPTEALNSGASPASQLSEDSAQKQSAEGSTEQGFLAHTFPVQQTQSKSTIRVPFKTNDRQAVCRVRLKIADDMLLKPTDAIELVGRQDTVWTVALNDDSVNLSVYLRSIPAKSWYIATAVRLRMSPDVEIPIGPKDATHVCLRLQNYLRWLDQNRMVGESMRSNKKQRAMAIAGLEQIEKQSKAAEKSLKNWLVIENLVLAFYRENAFELELASSSDKLPAR